MGADPNSNNKDGIWHSPFTPGKTNLPDGGTMYVDRNNIDGQDTYFIQIANSNGVLSNQTGPARASIDAHSHVMLYEAWYDNGVPRRANGLPDVMTRDRSGKLLTQSVTSPPPFSPSEPVTAANMPRAGVGENCTWAGALKTIAVSAQTGAEIGGNFVGAVKGTASGAVEAPRVMIRNGYDPVSSILLGPEIGSHVGTYFALKHPEPSVVGQVPGGGLGATIGAVNAIVNCAEEKLFGTATKTPNPSGP